MHNANLHNGFISNTWLYFLQTLVGNYMTSMSSAMLGKVIKKNQQKRKNLDE